MKLLQKKYTGRERSAYHCSICGKWLIAREAKCTVADFDNRAVWDVLVWECPCQDPNSGDWDRGMV